MNKSQQLMIEQMPDKHADRVLVTVASDAMREKLAKKREDGLRGWHTSLCTNEQLGAMLLDHFDKGDMVDVMNFAAMIHVRTQLYGPSAKQAN